MIDLVYVLGTGSQNGDFELAHSLRSAQVYLRGFRKVFIVGTKPRIKADFGVPWQHVPVTDLFGWPACNINECLRWACAIPELSDTFLRVDDDCFFLRDQDAEKTPFYARGDLATHVLAWKGKPGSAYLKSLEVTEDWLSSKGFPTLDFEVHGPMLFHKKTLGSLLAGLDPAKGYLIRSLYANVLRLPGAPLEDCKIATRLTTAQIESRIGDRDFFSIGDGGLSLVMRTFLGRRYTGQLIG